MLIYSQWFTACGSVEPGGLWTASQEFIKRLIRVANLPYLLFKCLLLYCKFLKSPPEGRDLCVLGLFLLIEMVGIENMARQRILIKGYVYLAIRSGALALVGNAIISWHKQQ